MVVASAPVTDLEISAAFDVNADLNFDLPDPEDEAVGDFRFSATHR